LTRFPAFRCDPYGDEAWYFYISKKVYWNWEPHLPFLPPLRWAFMLIMHPFTQNIWVFRSAYTVINALALLALYKVARDPLVLLLAGLFVVLDPAAIFFTGAVFTSTLGGTLTLLALATDNFWLSLFLAVLAVGSWEGVMFPFFVLALLEGRKDRKKLLYLVPVALALGMAFDNKLYHKWLPGWAKGPVTLDTLRDLFFPVGYFLPLLLSPSQLLLAWSEALGLVAVNLVHGTLIEAWYQAPAHALYAYSFARLKRSKKVLVIGLLGLLIALYGFKMAEGALYGPKECCRLLVRDYLKVAGGKVILYHTFWAYPHYPFGDVPHAACWSLKCVERKAASGEFQYVFSDGVMLKYSWLKLIYHKGPCYLFKISSPPG
jgi:hypothetical protein